jgi:hypothetical protein
MRRSIWNAQHMAPIKKIEDATKFSNRRFHKPPKAKYPMKIKTRIDMVV